MHVWGGLVTSRVLSAHAPVLYVEYAEQRIKSGILFIFSLFHEYNNLEYVHIHVIYRVDQAEHVIRIRVATSQEYVNTYSTRSAPVLGLVSLFL